jgi:hypothetical protein
MSSKSGFLGEKNTVFYNCKNCDYNTCNKKDFNKHNLTAKHQKNALSTNFNKNGILDENIPKIYDCVCGKIYKERSGLWRHKQKCNGSTEKHKQVQQIDTNLIIELLKQNQELQKSLIELSKEKSITNNNNNITNNKTFNLHVYLNEDCKDALNINDFVSSIKVQLEDLEETGRLGYVEGVSRIINRTLGDLDQNKRPIQCSDLKRETLYIKDDDKWIKEGEDKEKIKLAIKQIANKNIQQIPVWVKENPGCRDSDSRKNDIYLNIVSNAMAGGNKEEQETNINKIVSKISKEAVIEK